MTLSSPVRTKIQTLDNGTTLVLIQNETQNSMAALVAVGVGSRDEERGQRGAAHFVEHMRFKGTKKRPTFFDISTFVESKGGNHNAWTSNETTAFHVQMSGDDSRAAVDVVHDIFANGEFREPDFDSEKGVILEEVRGYENDPDSCAFQSAMAAGFRGSSVGLPVAGTSAEVERLSLRVLAKFHRSHYVPSRTVVVLSGGVSWSAFEMARSRFGRMRGATSPARAPSAVTVKPFQEYVVAPTDRFHVAVVLPGFSLQDPMSVPGRLASAILGSFSCSRLTQAIREERGLCYGIDAHASYGSDHGATVIHMSTERKNFPEAMKILVGEIVRLGKEGPTAAELRMAKSHLRGSLSIHMDDPMGIAERAASGVLAYGKYRKPEETVAEFGAASLSSVRRAAALTMSPASIGFTIAGPKRAGKEALACLDAALKAAS